MAGQIEPDVGAILARRQIQSATRRVLASTRGLGRAVEGGALGTERGQSVRAETRALARAAHRSLQGIGQGDAASQALHEVRASLGRLREMALQGSSAERNPGWARELGGLVGAAGRLVELGSAGFEAGLRGPRIDSAASGLDAAAPIPVALGSRAALGAATAKLAAAGGAAAALGSLDAAFKALARAEEHLASGRAQALERHAALERAERGTLRGGAPPEEGAEVGALAADVAARLAHAPRAALETAERTPPEVALELLAQGPIELPPLPSVDAPRAARDA